MKLALLSAVAALAMAASAAKADNFDFSYTSSGTAVKGTFVTTQQGVGTYLITDIIGGTRGTYGITLNSPGSYAGFGDNILRYPATGSQFFTLDGVVFTANGVLFNIYATQSNIYRESTFNGGAIDVNNVSVSRAVTAVPGPLAGAGLIPLMGLIGAAFLRRRLRIEA